MCVRVLSAKYEFAIYTVVPANCTKSQGTETKFEYWFATYTGSTRKSSNIIAHKLSLKTDLQFTQRYMQIASNLRDSNAAYKYKAPWRFQNAASESLASKKSIQTSDMEIWTQ